MSKAEVRREVYTIRFWLLVPSPVLGLDTGECSSDDKFMLVYI